MSGSPKYSTVAVSAAYARREAQRRRERENERRRQQERRARQRAELAARRAQEAAVRREKAKAEAERRKHALEARRAAEQQAHALRRRQEQAGADARRLDEVRQLFAQVRSADAPAAQLDALQRQLDQLGERVARAEPLGGAIEELRGRIVVLSDTAHTRGRAPDDRASVLDGLERQLAGMAPDTAALDPAGRQDCEDLLGRLRAATGPGAETRFEALLGTVEHALTRHAATAGRRAAEDGRRAEDDRRRTEEEQRRAVERETARAAAEEAERERVEAVLTEAADRLGVVQESAEDAVAEARELGDPNLAERIGQALRAGTAALGAKEPDAALKAVGDLEELLTEAESELDELHIAHTRRSDLALALQDAMIGEGFAFTGGDEDGDAIVLRFQRPSGATYETTVATEDDGNPLLVYHVDGEPDVVLHPPAEGAVCDQTEDLLERVHEAIGEQDGFVPGELTWQGKPPSRQAKQLPGTEEWRWTR